MRHRALAALLLLTTLTVSLFLYFRFRSYDLVSAGLCRVAPFSSPCSSASSTALEPSVSGMTTQKIHAATHGHRRRGRISLSIGSLNIRYSHDAAYDSTQSMLSSYDHLLTAARKGTQFAPSVDSPGSPYLMQQYRGERSWLLRGPKVADTPLFYDWDLFAFQEVLDGQYRNLVQWLGEEYDHAGVGRDDGERKGEAVPVFWRRDTFELVDGSQGGVGENGVEHFWLSPTPDVVGSVGWDAALTRMCTHVSLRLLATREIIHVFSTHYDHQGVVARSKSSELIVKRARAASAHTRAFYQTQSFQSHLSEPLVVLIGDLNSPRNEGSWSTLVSPHYGLAANSSGSTFLDTALSVPTRFRSPLLTDNEDPHRSELASGREQPSSDGTPSTGGLLSEPVGPLRTFTDFQPSARNAIDDRIDFIMLLDNQAVRDETKEDTTLDHSPSPPPPAKAGAGVVWARDEELPSVPLTRDLKQGQAKHDDRWRIRSFGTLPNWSEGDAGFLISDHRPVMARIQRTLNSS
ncbi:uncharacterized protein UTRI_00774_B [Ustilago trichophora]|uniref:Endonuclease/exonuclease/phosphatase domain-containing protein n=1 Tax=Ustilago trichophora TaxID=86804 RepID=A0A5C3DSH5_9BASI|nr:uncharacterized protein UTRI_00774_B [Ustilago trichophora]